MLPPPFHHKYAFGEQSRTDPAPGTFDPSGRQPVLASSRLCRPRRAATGGSGRSSRVRAARSAGRRARVEYRLVSVPQPVRNAAAWHRRPYDGGRLLVDRSRLDVVVHRPASTPLANASPRLPAVPATDRAEALERPARSPLGWVTRYRHAQVIQDGGRGLSPLHSDRSCRVCWRVSRAADVERLVGWP